MSRVFRAGMLAAIALLAVRAWRVTTYDAEFRRGALAYEDRAYAVALERFEAARSRADGDPLVWTWIGDAAAALHNNPPTGGWEAEPERERTLLDRIWAGYAGGVLRAPRDSWSWSGLADGALRRARRADRESVLDLRELDRRRSGIVDPWRGAALAAARIAVELKPSGYLELDVLAELHESAGNTEAAREAYLRSARMMPAPSFHPWGSGRRPLPASLYDGVLAGLREGLASAPEFERSVLHLGIGRFALAHGDTEAAIEEMAKAERAAESRHDRYHAARDLATAFEAAGRLEEALAAIERAFAISLNVPADRRQRGGLLYRLDRKAEACGDLREAVREWRSDSELRVFAAIACEEGGELETAEQLLREGFVDPTDDLALARGLLDFYLRTGQRSTAGALARRWARDFPGTPELSTWEAEFAERVP